MALAMDSGMLISFVLTNFRWVLETLYARGAPGAGTSIALGEHGRIPPGRACLLWVAGIRNSLATSYS